MTQTYFDWTTSPFAAAEFAARRTKLYSELTPNGGTLLIPSRHHFSDGYTFRQLDDFYYFCGLELPDSILALDAGQGRGNIVCAGARSPL